MSRLRFIFLFQVIAIGGSLRADAQALGDLSEKEAEASSILQAFTANMRAIECFDMSMTYERYHVATEDKIATQSSLRTRYICDFREGSHLIVGLQRMHRLSLDSDEEVRNQRFRGVFVNAKEKDGWLLTEGGRSMGIELRDKAKEYGTLDRWALFLGNFPDPRFVGSSTFPQVFIKETSIEDLFQQFVHSKNDTSLHETAEENHAEIIRTPGPQESGSGLKLRWLMDMERFVPLRLAVEVVPKDGDVWRKAMEEISWQDLEGMVVPLEIHGERRIAPRRELRDRREPTSEFYDVVFSWHSVNKPHELPEVNKRILTDSEALLRLLDEDSGATETPAR